VVTPRSDEFERERGFELRGEIESVAADRSSFVLRGITVGTQRSDLRYVGGDAANLVVQRRVRVKGVLAGNGAGLAATEIRFE
jgi:hypothetical protein